MTGTELDQYLRDLADQTAAAARDLQDAERQNFILGKMAVLQTYLTSTGRSDDSAFRVVETLQAMVEERLAEACEPFSGTLATTNG